MDFCKRVTSFKEFAEVISAKITEIAKTSGDKITVGLSGGSTIPPVMKALAEDELKALLPENLVWTWIDERLVTYDHAGSNYGSMKDFIPKGEDLPLPFEDGVDKAAAYQTAFSGSELPALDLLVLGFGDDGHIASLFPGTAALEKDCTATDWLFRNEAGYEPKQRWSWGMKALTNSKNTIVVYKGGATGDKVDHMRAAVEDAKCDTPLARFVRQTEGELSYYQVDL